MPGLLGFRPSAKLSAFSGSPTEGTVIPRDAQGRVTFVSSGGLVLDGTRMVALTSAPAGVLTGALAAALVGALAGTISWGLSLR